MEKQNKQIISDELITEIAIIILGIYNENIKITNFAIACRRDHRFITDEEKKEIARRDTIVKNINDSLKSKYDTKVITKAQKEISKIVADNIDFLETSINSCRVEDDEKILDDDTINEIKDYLNNGKGLNIFFQRTKDIFNAWTFKSEFENIKGLTMEQNNIMFNGEYVGCIDNIFYAKSEHCGKYDKPRERYNLVIKGSKKQVIKNDIDNVCSFYQDKVNIIDISNIPPKEKIDKDTLYEIAEELIDILNDYLNGIDTNKRFEKFVKYDKETINKALRLVKRIMK